MSYSCKVTIGIPIYNAEKYLRKAIDSVLNQSFADFELILSDDGSTDNSLSIIKSYDDKRIRLISDGVNKGISYRLNEQIENAKGEFFARMDADDIMFPNRIQQQFDFLINNPNVDIVGAYSVIIDETNNIIGSRTSSIPSSFYDVLKQNVFIHPTVMGKTSWFNKFKYTDELKGVEDYDLWVRSFSSSQFSIMKEYLLFYRDPLAIKLSTYQFRHKQSRRAYLHYRKNFLRKTYFVKLMLISYFKVIIYTIAHNIGLSKFFAARRNKMLNGDEILKYSTILRKALS